MTKLSIIGLLVSLIIAVAPARAQEIAPEDWQTVITAQIEAFREHDSPAALSFAGKGFAAMFSDPEAFYQAIVVDWGYAPIAESRSHSFGQFQVLHAKSVLQRVTIVGGDQAIYDAVYRVNLEDAGWRVGSVDLVKTPGMGV